jgi:hypothetical protein
MRASLRGLASLGYAFSIVACASTSQAPIMVRNGRDTNDTFSVRVRRDAIVVETFLRRSAAETWAAMPAAFADLAFKGGPSVVPTERVYMTPELTISGQLFNGETNSTYIDCGKTPAGSPAADEYTVRFTVLVKVAPVDSGSVLSFLVDGMARDKTKSVDWVSCTGTGRLENMFFKAISRRAGAS